MDIGRKKGSGIDVKDNDTSIRVPSLWYGGTGACRNLGMDGEVEEKEGCGCPPFGGQGLSSGQQNRRMPFPGPSEEGALQAAPPLRQ